MATKKINGVYHVSNTQTGGSGDDPNAVKYVEQTLTDAQKAQARTNINAPSVADLNAIGNGSYVEAWDGASTPVVADIPAGVVVTYNTTDYTGTLAASASTVGKIYLVSTGTSGNYDRYITETDGTNYSWHQIGTTAIDLSDYATKEEVSQLSQEVTIINSNIGEVPPAQMAEDLEYSKVSATFWDAYNADNATLAQFIYAPFIVKSIKIGVITSLTAKFATIGKITIGKIKRADVIDGQAFDYTKVFAKKSYNISTTGERTIQIEPLYIADGEYVAVGMPGDSAEFYYGLSGGTMSGYYWVDSSHFLTHDSRYLGVKVDGYEYTTIPCTMVENGFLASDKLTSIVGVERVNRFSYNGYSASNRVISIPGNSPFILTKDFDNDYYVNSIKIRIAVQGNLTIGKIKKDNVKSGEIADRSKIFDKIILTFNDVGEYICKLPSSWDSRIKIDEYLTIQDVGDTAKFYYGNTTPADSSFFYVEPGTQVWAGTSSSLNVDVNVDFIYQYSSYRGKKISILGDSISTFAGYISEGNATYYPSGTVLRVEDTWWKKLIDALGLVLDTNNSWSGSRVTTTGGETSAGCMTRSQSLGSPDVIIVWMGINDFNNEVALGTYDGKSEIPTATTTFREAYGIMLNKILTAYPTAEVWVCTLPQCERNGSAGFPEINGNGVALVDFNIAIEELARAFGVKVLDHNRCGLTYQNMSVFNPDNLHPNKYGHSLVANNDIRQMDNAIRRQYPID